MINKKLSFLSIFLSAIFLLACFSIQADELYTAEDAWKKKDVYRPSPLLFLHGFAAGAAKSWDNVIEQMQTKVSDDKMHFDKYYKPNNSGNSFGKRQPYLEIIQFFNDKDSWRQRLIDKNSSIDTYKVGDNYVKSEARGKGNPGWGDKVYYWLKGDVLDGVTEDSARYLLQKTGGEGFLSIYDNREVNLICHSMGGLAAREYLRLAGSDSVDKLITIGTPHLGTGLANKAKTVTNIQRGIWWIPAYGWLWAIGTEIADQGLQLIADIDMDGDAVRDMSPDSDFLNMLNSSGTSGVDYYAVCGKALGLSGDGIVSFESQLGHGVLNIPIDQWERISSNHSAETSKVSMDNCNILLKFLDDTEPVLDLVRVLESKDINLSELPEKDGGGWDNEDTDWTQHLAGEDAIELDLKKYGKVYIEGKVNKEYLPATSEVKIAVFKRNKKQSATHNEDELRYWGYESEDFGYVTKEWVNLKETKDSRYLKPYANKTPAPAGFRYEIKFDSYPPESGIYDVKVFIENPAGLKSDVKAVKVKIKEPLCYFHVKLSPEYVETGSPVSQTQAFTIKIQCYNYGTSETRPEVEGERYVDKKEGTESWWHYVNEEQEIDEWKKEKINPDCIAPEEWGKSDYAGEVSFGINTSGYELCAGGEKLETLKLVDGTGSISGVVIKANDGNIGDNHLFLIISASDGAGSGNGALIINPVVVNGGIRNSKWKRSFLPTSGGWNLEIFNEGWHDCLYGYWYGSQWTNGWVDLTWGPSPDPHKDDLAFYGQIYRAYGSIWLSIQSYKYDVVYNLSEEALGYAPNEIEKAWMKADVIIWNVHKEKYPGSAKNKTTGEVGVLKAIDDTHRYVIWQSVPVSDFGSSKLYEFEPSLNTEGDEGASQLKPEYDTWGEWGSPSSISGIQLTSAPQILFIPKTEE